MDSAAQISAQDLENLPCPSSEVRTPGHVRYEGGAESKYNDSDDSIPITKHFATNYKAPKPPRTDDGLIRALCFWVFEHQIGLALNFVILLVLTHACFPKARQTTRKFFEISYYNPNTQRYAVGWDDAYFVISWIVLFTGLRAAMMEYAFAPLAKRGGISKKKEKVRFAEQAWQFVYYLLYWSIGMSIWSSRNYWFNFLNLWRGWPDREIDGLCKWYYLTQFAFWLQQIVVVNIEERRKDHMQMLTHHFITSALLYFSYGYHYTRVGIVVLCIMDPVDAIFALAKMLKYLHYDKACDITFGVFVAVWVGTRHVLYPAVCWSLWSDAIVNDVVPKGCWTGSNSNLEGPFEVPKGWGWLILPFIDPAGPVCHTNLSLGVFLALLMLLQVLLLIWFGMIVRLAWKVITGNGAEDPRSDDEDEVEEYDEIDEEHGGQSNDRIKNHKGLNGGALKKGALQGSEPSTETPAGPASGSTNRSAENRQTYSTRRYKKGLGTSSGVTLPHDTKELLGRIGCDKQT